MDTKPDRTETADDEKSETGTQTEGYRLPDPDSTGGRTLKRCLDELDRRMSDGF